MIGSLGLPELLFILVVALLIFGPRKLPEIGRTMGKALGEFRRATSDLKRTLDVEMEMEEVKSPPARKIPGVVSPEEQVASTEEQAASPEEPPAVDATATDDPPSSPTPKSGESD